MKHILFIIAAVLSIVSCSDTIDDIGMSLVTNTNEDVMADAKSFNITSKSVKAENIISRSSYSYLGRIKDPETEAYVTCNFMTQLHNGGVTQFPYESEYDKNYGIQVESCELCVYFNNNYGDSLALMKVVAHELEKPFEEKDRLSATEVDTKARSMIRSNNGLHVQASYTYSNHAYSEKDRNSSSYSPRFTISLNEPYTATAERGGKTYPNYGQYLVDKVLENKEACSNEWYFQHNVCPGFYLEVVGGIGNLATINSTQIIIHFKTMKDGKETKGDLAFSGTEEVIQKTAIIQDETKINEFLNEDCTYLRTPAGLFTELTLPVNDIMSGHENDTLNTVRVFIPRINNETTNSYNLPIPKNVLLLPSDSIKSFFDNHKVADYRTSHIATYGSTQNGYTFGNISEIISDMYRKQKASGKDVAAYTQDNPSWNKVTLIPVETTKSTLSSGTSVVTKVTHDMSLGSTKLQKGTAENGNIKASVIYSHYK